MIILDTNVLSEPIRSSPHAGVIRWLDAQAMETLWLTAITVAEIHYGIASLADGRRRIAPGGRIDNEVLPKFGGRVLEFGLAEAVAYADLRADARRVGRAIGGLDALIAAIAVSRSATVATRDAAPFVAAGVPVINPFVVSD
ncbi:type II toxin-antitoxin system VapC family toxin [Tomitella fengzijianii]|uniref:Ribonuclease VapC n=1 Tax=Tomitella fengzijianii TaxID=2597660 RepID=A0A516X173_9ACTN|nr:type II toxin-antitoxin system VapC family toxin [Tomitella fengzijianii]QDQ96818.1 type II toxin-antitoxin system VapC family toxin [Tomitella fengzijianii]